MHNASEAQIGKVLGLQRYMHVDAIPFASTAHQDLIARARLFSGLSDNAFNVVRVNAYACQVSFLLYPRFFEDPFPVLHSTAAIDLNRSLHTKRSYQDSLTPPILHRKELLLPSDHPARAQFQALTAALEALGVFQTAAPIGFKRQWTELLANTGYSVIGHTLIPIGNQLIDDTTDCTSCSESIARHLTALSR
jgi:DNA phosphorothioation-associated putative methyltransferase